MIQNEQDFHNWLELQLNNEIPAQVIAFSVNIYEAPFKIEIVGSNEFDPDNENWACNEDWVPEQRTISVSKEIFGNSWEDAQENMITMARKYLASGSKNAIKLKAAKAFVVGFVDGNLHYVH